MTKLAYVLLLTAIVSQCTVAQIDGYLQINSNLGVRLVVTNPTGQRTGADPRGVHSDTAYKLTWLSEIPGANYSFSSFAGGGEDSSTTDWIESTEFVYSTTMPRDAGVYAIQAIGVELGSYWIHATVDKDITDTSKQSIVVANGIIEKDSVVTYRLTYLGADTSMVTLTKVVNPRTLLQDLGAMRNLGWITNQPTSDKYVNLVTAYNFLMQSNNVGGARTTLITILQNLSSDSLNALSTDACGSLRRDIEYLLTQLPVSPPSGLSVKLVNSAGTNLTGGSLQYYDASWKDATNNNDGTFKVNTTLATVSLRMTYEGGSQTKSNVAVGPNVVVFQTVNTQVKLQNSTGVPIDTGTVQYYYSSWQTLGHTMNGVASKELLPASYTFRMTYAAATNDKQQDIGTNATVVFSTVSAGVQLKNSAGSLIDQGTVQYYFSSWQTLGNTMNGVATKELLPANYTFRMSYASATKDKQQNIGTNPTVVFNTVNATVQLKNSQGSFIDQGTVQYYFSSWKTFGSTANGVAAKELLPTSYTFRMAYESVTNDKVQDISTNSAVSFSTVLCTVIVKNGQGQPVDGAQVSYYFSSWVPIGATVGGQVTKELLPASMTFRETIGSATQNKLQNIGTNALVEFSVQ